MAETTEFERYETLMERMVAAYRARILAICKSADLTPPQFWALKMICQLERTKMSPLAEELALSMGAVSTLVDRLVSRGLVERCADAHDRRAVFVSLTEKGRSVLDSARRTKREEVRQTFERVAPELRPQLLSGLEALADAWSNLTEGQEARLGHLCEVEE